MLTLSWMFWAVAAIGLWSFLAYRLITYIRTNNKKDLEVNASRETWLFPDSESTLLETKERFPNTEAPLLALARLYSRTENFEKANAAWQDYRRLLPTKPEGYYSGASALAKLGRQQEAEKLLAAGLKRCPADVTIAVRYIEMARHRNDLPAAAERVARSRRRFGDHPWVVAEMARLQAASER
jgi:predicted Zn-dependent protease